LGTVVQARTYSGLSGTAQLRQLSDAADPTTRTFEARFILMGAPAAAPLGSTVTVGLGEPGQAGAITVPLAAIYDRGGGPGVWLVSTRGSPKVSWRPVKLAAIGDESAVVSAGLRPGERFVALGAHMLRQGQAVRIAGAGR
jgi:multidrug efflux pump subunit AcrA (membrane-fusion protein)